MTSDHWQLMLKANLYFKPVTSNGDTEMPFLF